MLQKIDDPELVVLNVWVPMVWGDGEKAARRATSLLPDPRVRHFWFDGKDLGKAYQHALDLPEVAWDIYFVYPPGARWEEEPPVPIYFMHQLFGLPQETMLDGEVLAERVRRLLEG